MSDLARIEALPRAARGRFPDGLRLDWLRARTWRLVVAFRFHSRALGWVTVPAGMVTDLVSLPGLVRLLFRVDGPELPAAIVHDYLYIRASSAAYPELTRRAAARVFLEGMVLLGVPAWRRWLYYAGVRLGGGRAWREL